MINWLISCRRVFDANGYDEIMFGLQQPHILRECELLQRSQLSLH